MAAISLSSIGLHEVAKVNQARFRLILVARQNVLLKRLERQSISEFHVVIEGANGRNDETFNQLERYQHKTSVRKDFRYSSFLKIPT